MENYLKTVDLLTINNNNQKDLEKKISELKENNKDNDKILKQNYMKKDEQIEEEL